MTKSEIVNLFVAVYFGTIGALLAIFQIILMIALK